MNYICENQEMFALRDMETGILYMSDYGPYTEYKNAKKAKSWADRYLTRHPVEIVKLNVTHEPITMEDIERYYDRNREDQ